MNNNANEFPGYTPWGEPQRTKLIAEGIVEISTAEHGGMWLSWERHREMAKELQEFKPWDGIPWYEEDQNWIIPYAAFRGLYQAYWAKELERWTGAKLHAQEPYPSYEVTIEKLNPRSGKTDSHNMFFGPDERNTYINYFTKADERSMSTARHIVTGDKEYFSADVVIKLKELLAIP